MKNTLSGGIRMQSIPELSTFGIYMEYMLPQTIKLRLKRERRKSQKAIEGKTEKHGKEDE